MAGETKNSCHKNLPDVSCLFLSVEESSEFTLQVERRFLQNQWRAKNKALQLKAAELANSLSEEEFQEYKGLKDYLAGKDLRDRLTSGAEKNFLGYYKGEAGVWDKLIRAYEVESKLLAFQLNRNALSLDSHMVREFYSMITDVHALLVHTTQIYRAAMKVRGAYIASELDPVILCLQIFT